LGGAIGGFVVMVWLLGWMLWLHVVAEIVLMAMIIGDVVRGANCFGGCDWYQFAKNYTVFFNYAKRHDHLTWMNFTVISREVEFAVACIVHVRIDASPIHTA
jgi:hypothetical protein